MPSFSALRSQFPALQLRDAAGRPAIYFDGPGGTQVPQRVIEAVSDYYVRANANTHGPFATSQETDEILLAAREAMADFFNAASSQQIVFGANMTTLTFHMSRCIGRDLQAGDEIVLTRLDHDANVAPWLALEERGVKIRFLDFHPEDCTLAYEQLGDLLSKKTKLVAVGYASNAVGTINDVRRIVQMAQTVGALTYIDAVHYAPHGPIDVQGLDCDFLVCSAYKFFGPHLGVLYGKAEAFERFQAYKVRPQDEAPPYRFETGTLNHEGIAGAAAAIDYLAEVGATCGAEQEAAYKNFSGRKRLLKTAMAAIQNYERGFSEKLIAGLQAVPQVKIFGITDRDRMHERTPTVSIRMQHSPRVVAGRLGRENIYVWEGNFYALEVTMRLDIEEHGGLVRIGLVHYNTAEEITRCLQALQGL
jgi:cysteine desulfurase family protein (TIGR01976 family)